MAEESASHPSAGLSGADAQPDLAPYAHHHAHHALLTLVTSIARPTQYRHTAQWDLHRHSTPTIHLDAQPS